MLEDSIFTKIIQRQISAYIIYEDDTCIAFLDVHPVQPGHTLVVPKQQIDRIEDLSDEMYAHLWSVVKKLIVHYNQQLPDWRMTLKTEGFDVPHAHIHIIPCREAKDFWRRTSSDDPIDDNALKNMHETLKVTV